MTFYDDEQKLFQNIVGKKIVDVELPDSINPNKSHNIDLLKLIFSDGTILQFYGDTDYGCDCFLDPDILEDGLEQIKKGIVVKAEIREVDLDYKNEDYDATNKAVFYEIVTALGGSTTLVFRANEEEFYYSGVRLKFLSNEDDINTKDLKSIFYYSPVTVANFVNYTNDLINTTKSFVSSEIQHVSELEINKVILNRLRIKVNFCGSSKTYHFIYESDFDNSDVRHVKEHVVTSTIDPFPDNTYEPLKITDQKWVSIFNRFRQKGI